MHIFLYPDIKIERGEKERESEREREAEREVRGNEKKTTLKAQNKHFRMYKDTMGYKLKK